jgi:hypothetical protein
VSRPLRIRSSTDFFSTCVQIVLIIEQSNVYCDVICHIELSHNITFSNSRTWNVQTKLNKKNVPNIYLSVFNITQINVHVCEANFPFQSVTKMQLTFLFLKRKRSFTILSFVRKTNHIYTMDSRTQILYKKRAQ